jgi:hypothetical protein
MEPMSNEQFGEYTRVTEILHRYYDFGNVQPAVLNRAAERGTRVHDVCQKIALGKASEVNAGDILYIANFNEWFSNVDKVIAVEERFFHESFKITGQVDLICRLKGDTGLTIVDLKTAASYNPIWRAQLAAYKLLAEGAGFKIDRVMALRLSGKHPLINESTGTLAVDTAGFLNAMTAHQYFEEIKGVKKMNQQNVFNFESEDVPDIVESDTNRDEAPEEAAVEDDQDETEIDDADLFSAFSPQNTKKASPGPQAPETEPVDEPDIEAPVEAPKKRTRKASGEPRKPRAKKNQGVFEGASVFNLEMANVAKAGQALVVNSDPTPELDPAPVISGSLVFAPKLPAKPVESPQEFYDSQIPIAKGAFEYLEAGIVSWTKEADAIEVNSLVGKTAAADLLIPLAKALKELETTRKGFVEAPNQFVKRINNIAGGIKDKISAITDGLKNKIAAYSMLERVEAQKKAEAERRAIEEIRQVTQSEIDNLNAAAIKADPNATLIEAPEMPNITASEPPKTLRTEAGSVSTIQRWSFRVVDPNLIPREFLTVDESAIRAAVKSGVRQIQGVVIYEDAIVRVG